MKSYPIKTGQDGAFITALASNYALAFLTRCYVLRETQCADIPREAPWNLRALSKSDYSLGGFIYPAIDQPVPMQSLNGWKGTMSPEACGIALSMTAFSWLSFAAYEKGHNASMERLSQSFHFLRAAAYEHHSEAVKIAAFCD